MLGRLCRHVHVLPGTALLMGRLTPRAVFVSLERVHEHTLSKQGVERIDRSQHSGTSPVFVTKKWEAQEGVIAVSEDGFGKQQPRTPAQWDNDKDNREKEAAKGN